MRLFVRSWLGLACLALGSVPFACATSTYDDLGLGTGVVIASSADATREAGHDAGAPPSSDSGLPTITITTDGGSFDPAQSATPDATPSRDAGEAPSPDATAAAAPDATVDVAAHVDTGATTEDAGTDAAEAGSAIPTTCARANGGAGCCGPDDTVYYCKSDGVTVGSTACSGAKVCGWRAASSSLSAGYYCVTPPASPDPSGEYPMACR